MLVKLLQAFNVEGKHYPLGVQEIPDEVLKHKHFLKYMKAGLIIEAHAAEALKVESNYERGLKLANLLHATKKKVQPLVKDAKDAELVAEVPPQDEAPGEDPNGEEESAPDESVEQKEDSKKKKLKQKR